MLENNINYILKSYLKVYQLLGSLQMGEEGGNAANIMQEHIIN